LTVDFKARIVVAERMFNDGQSKTAAAGLARARFIDAIETLCQTGNMLC